MFLFSVPAFHSRYFLQGTCFNSSLNNLFYSHNLHVTVSYVNYTVDLARVTHMTGSNCCRVNLFWCHYAFNPKLCVNKIWKLISIYFLTFELFFSDYNENALMQLYVTQSGLYLPVILFFHFTQTRNFWKDCIHLHFKRA